MNIINKIKTYYKNKADRKKLTSLKQTADCTIMLLDRDRKAGLDVTIYTKMYHDANDAYERFKATLPLTKEEEHKNYLIELYTNLSKDKTKSDFQRLVFQRGLRMVTNGKTPKYVENYVENLIKIWLYK